MELFCLTSSKIIVGEPVCVSELLWLQILLDNRGITILSIVLVSQYQKTSWVNAFVFQKVSSTEKVYAWKGGCHVFPSNFFCPKLPKNIVRAPSCVSKLFWYQKSLDNRSIAILSSFFVSHRQESSRANPSVFQNYSGFKIFWIIRVSRFC